MVADRSTAHTGSWSAKLTAAGPDVVARLLVGNAVLSVLFTLVGYVIAFRFVRAYRRRAIDVASVLE